MKTPEGLTLDDEWTKTLLRLAVPREAVDKLTPENLGRLQIERISFGYYEDARPEKARSILLLEGVAHDGRKRIIDFLRRTNSDKLQVEEIATGGEASKLIRVSGPDLPFALSLLDDYHAVFARSLNKDAGRASTPQGAGLPPS